ncbi:MAG: RNA 2',3'-cyclic phosphodiesterase [Chloroflexota bacterium]
MQEKKIRTFIAIDLPEEVKHYLEAVSKELDQQMPKRAVRWVKPELMHLTLRFLGDTTVSQLPSISKALSAHLTEKSFSLKLSQLGAFPNKNKPRVIWVGLGGEMKRLQQTQAQVETALTDLDWPPDRLPFKPHLTLGRVKQTELFKGKTWGGHVEPLAFDVTAVHLMQSELTSKGPNYSILESVGLS